MNPEFLTLGEMLRLMRKRAKISQTQLSRRLGVHISTISRWERDQNTEEMSVKHFFGIVRLTRVSLRDLAEFIANFERSRHENRP